MGMNESRVLGVQTPIISFTVCDEFSSLRIVLCRVCSELFSWPARRLSNSSCFLHAFGWGIPAGLTVAAVLTAGAIQADEVTGVCSVGGQTEDMLLYFVILPEVMLPLYVISAKFLNFLLCFRVSASSWWCLCCH